MYEIKFQEEIERLIENRHKIPDEFWILTAGKGYQAIWFMDRQKPSVEQSYDFDEERFGITKDGKVIWGFDSGCSCPTPWVDSLDGTYEVKEWKEFAVSPEQAFDADWQDECYKNLQDFLKLIDDNLSADEVLSIQNAEIRRYLIKRVGYENIKNKVGATVLHKDGTSELLEFSNGEKYVKVKDSSTDREYLLYVGNSWDKLMTCKAAIASTFGLREEEYNPLIES